jgi:hypothetical protein
VSASTTPANTEMTMVTVASTDPLSTITLRELGTVLEGGLRGQLRLPLALLVKWLQLPVMMQLLRLRCRTPRRLVINSSTSINGVSAAEASGLMSCPWAPDKGPGLPQIYHYGVSSLGLPPATSTLISGNPNSFAVSSPSPSRWNVDPVIYCAEVGAPFLPIWPSQIQSKKGR